MSEALAFISTLLSEYRQAAKPVREPRLTGETWVDASGPANNRTIALLFRDIDADVTLGPGVNGQGRSWTSGTDAPVSAPSGGAGSLYSQYDGALWTWNGSSWNNVGDWSSVGFDQSLNMADTPQFAGLGIGTAGVSGQIRLDWANGDLIRWVVDADDVAILDAGRLVINDLQDFDLGFNHQSSIQDTVIKFFHAFGGVIELRANAGIDTYVDGSLYSSLSGGTATYNNVATVTRDSGDLTISTTTSGDVVLNPADDLLIGATPAVTGTVVVPTVGTLNFVKGIYTGLT